MLSLCLYATYSLPLTAFTKQGCDGQHWSDLTLNKKTNLAIFHYKPSGGRKGRAR